MSIINNRKLNRNNFHGKSLAYSVKTVFVGLLIITSFITVSSQSNYQVSPGNEAANLAPGTPAGSYTLNGFESINPYSGKLNFSLPLIKIGGRGNAGYTMNLNIQKNWSVLHNINDPNTYQPSSEQYEIKHSYIPTDFPDFASDTEFVGFIGGWMKGTRVGTNRNQRMCGYQPCYDETLTRLAFVQTDGTEIEFRDILYGGRAINHTGVALSVSRGTNWVSTDGSNATFIASGDIYDYRLKGAGNESFYPSGTLYLSNGTKYTIQDGRVMQISDINGNKVTPGKDSLGREITITESSPPNRIKTIAFKGINATVRNLKINYSSLADRLSSGYILNTVWGLFPSVPIPDATADLTYNPEVVSSVELPDGRKYEFRYNNYGELTEIILPTGGKIEYVWQSQSGAYGNAEGTVLPGPGGPPDDISSGFKIYRRVEKRRVYEGSVLQTETRYEAPEFLPDNEISVKVRSYINQNNNLVLVNYSKHYYYGSPYPSGVGAPGPLQLYQLHPTNDPPFLFGKELRTEIYDANNVLLRKTKNTWQPGASLAANPTGEINPRLTEVEETLADGNLISKKTFGYDGFNNQTEVYEYDFGIGAPGGFKRRSHTDFVSDTNYTSHTTGAHLRSLPLQSWVSSDINGTTKASLTQFEYDNYNTDTNHASLFSRVNVFGHDTTNYGMNKTNRGNVTKVTTYGNAQTQTEPISAYSQYDILGNVVKTIDAKGYISTIDYTDRFGSPDGEARSNIAPIQLNGQSTFAFPTSATNPIGYTAYTQVDYFTGAAVNAEDVNGVISKLLYNDVLDRPTQTVAAINTPFERQSNIIYDDANHRVETRSDVHALNDNLLKSESFYDGLGRTIESRRYESDGSFIATKSVPFVMVQDPETAIWRAGTKVSNPYRPNAGEQPIWTTSLIDSLGRGIKTITPDGVFIKTEYSGNTVTVTDQAGKKRRSVTNGLGQLTRVDEPNEAGQLDFSGNPAQPTTYAYDTLSNLTTVSQGGQTRSFVYDSLSRLKSATNPESGLMSYQYDNNSNLTRKTDARNIQTNYSYDVLNRVLTRSYTDGITPAVSYFYDNLPNAKGKLIKVSSAISTTEYTGFDILGRVLTHKQTTDGNAYTSGYTYNLSGALIEETYPSGRVVKNTLDNDGDLQQVQSRKANDTFRNYANSFNYTAAGAVSSMRLGNGKWETTSFNSRLQPTQIGLGSSATNQGLLKLNYDYGTTDNNGNVKSQQITVPTVGANTGFTAIQTYTYDSLNRLKDAKEMIGTTQTWKQTFTFDRYGNRNFDTANTTTLGSCPVNVCNPSINPVNNRLNGYGYDNAGNTTTDAENRSFIYDAENKQKEVKNSANQSIGQYFYDGDGKRVKKYVPTSGETTIFIYDASGKMVSEYSTTVAPVSEAKVSYLTNDHLGSPRITTDANGNVISRRDFMPFGEELTSAYTAQRNINLNYGQDTVRQKFTSYERDTESGLDFAKNRYHNYNLGRFTSTDPYKIVAEVELERDKEKGRAKLNRYLSIPQKWNRYAYVLNNPLKYTDPTGEDVIIRGKTEEERQRAALRYYNLVGNERAKLINVTKGFFIDSGEDFLVLSIDKKDLEKFAKIGDTDLNRDFSKKMGDILASSTDVEFGVTTSFTYKKDGKTLAVRDVRNDSGGGVTVPANESLTGNIQIWVAPDAAATGTRLAPSGKPHLTSDGNRLNFPDNSVVDGHEFGHGYDLMFGQTGNSINFENAVRERFPGQQRRKSEK